MLALQFWYVDGQSRSVDGKPKLVESRAGREGVYPMNRAYVLYCRIAAVIFIVNTLYPVTVKLLQHRLSHDWLHSFLHLMCALLGAYAGWRAKDLLPARAFTWYIGVPYFGLGVYGWFTPSLFLNSPLAIPLGIADNIFHLLLSMPALIIVVVKSQSAHGLITTSATLE